MTTETCCQACVAADHGMASGVVGIADNDTDPDLVEKVGRLSCGHLQRQLDDVLPFHG